MPQLPALQYRPPDVANALLSAEQIKGARSRNQLYQQQAQREERLRGIRQGLFTGADEQGMPKVDNAMMRQYAMEDPKGWARMVQALAVMDKGKREKIDRQNQLTGRILSGVNDPQTYEMARQEFESRGIETDDMPATYDPKWVAFQLRQTLAVDDWFKMQGETKVVGDNLVRIKPDGSVDVVHRGAKKAPKAQVETFYDNETGKEYRAQYDPATKEWKRIGGTKRGGGGERPADAKLADILVDEGVASDWPAAFEIVRNKRGSSEAEKRADALKWVNDQEDRYRRPKYKTPEETRAAYEGYMLITEGKVNEGFAKLQSVEKDKEIDKPGVLSRIFGGGPPEATAAVPPPTTPTPAGQTPTPSPSTPTQAPATPTEPTGPEPMPLPMTSEGGVDQSKLVVGQRYRNSAGQIGEWDGKMMTLVE